jgi:hypothetical protein
MQENVPPGLKILQTEWAILLPAIKKRLIVKNSFASVFFIHHKRLQI